MGTDMDQKLAEKRALNLMKEAPVAYLTTIDRDGYPQTRAMLNLRNSENYPGLCEIFSGHTIDLRTLFTTNTSSDKVKHIQENQKVSVYYCLPEQWRSLMMGGNIEVVKDKALKRDIWQKSWTMYYPGGAEDPDYAILSLEPYTAKYYENLASCTWKITSR